MPEQTPELARLISLVREVSVAMLTTVETDGSLRSRPMQVQEAEFDGTLRFFTQEHSGKVEEVERDRHVNVAISCPEKGIYVSLTGRANLSNDQTKKDELWRDEYREWFPKGKDDPELEILEVDVKAGEYWAIPNPNAPADEQSRESEHGEITM